MTNVTVNFADGTHIVADAFDAEDIVGAVTVEGDIIPVGKVENLVDTHVALTPCCFTSKTRDFTIYEEDSFFEFTYTTCGDCGAQLAHPEVFEDFLYSITPTPRV